MSKFTRLIGFIGAVAFAVPAVAQAQSCLGIPTSNGQFALSGSLGLPEGGKIWGAALTADLAGPLAVQAGWNHLKPEGADGVNQFGARASFDFPALAVVAACPSIGFSYSSPATDVSLTQIPLGVGIGKSLSAGPMANVTVYAMPHLLHTRVSGGGLTVSSNDFATKLGASVGMRSFYGNANVTVTSAENTDPMFEIGLGFLIGGNR